MRVLDLFAGLEGWSAPFRERGHEVVSVDLDPRFGCTYTADVLEWEPEGSFDIVLASPPCESFSVMTLGHNWRKEGSAYPHRIQHLPLTDKALLAVRLVERTRELIEQTEPSFFIIENPRAKLRKMPVLAGLERRTVTYCQFGEPFMKPTDLWGGFPPSLELPPACRPGDSCHVPAPRGSATGVQGSLEWQRNRRGNLTMHKRQKREMYGTSNQWELAALRAKIPEKLALAVCLAAESDLEAGLLPFEGRLL